MAEARLSACILPFATACVRASEVNLKPTPSPLPPGFPGWEKALRNYEARGPAKAGIQDHKGRRRSAWIPASAGMSGNVVANSR
jgi:hypothetical protein